MVRTANEGKTDQGSRSSEPQNSRNHGKNFNKHSNTAVYLPALARCAAGAHCGCTRAEVVGGALGPPHEMVNRLPHLAHNTLYHVSKSHQEGRSHTSPTRAVLMSTTQCSMTCRINKTHRRIANSTTEWLMGEGCNLWDKEEEDLLTEL
jgi:hypothetical protein